MEPTASTFNKESVQFQILQNTKYKNRKMLDKASGKGVTDIVKTLLELDVKPIADGGYSLCPLFSACMNNQYECINLLLDYKAKFGSENSDSEFKIAYVIMKCDVKILKILRKRGWNLTDALYTNYSMRKKSAIYYSIMDKNSEQALSKVKYLINQKADVNASQAGGQTLLHGAARVGNHGVVKALLEAGAEVNPIAFPDYVDQVWFKTRFTPLDYANKYHHEGVSQLLIDNGGLKYREIRPKKNDCIMM